MTWNDGQLVRRLQNHEPAAFEAVVERHYQLVFRQLWHLCHDDELAADLTQETFARAWGSLDGFAGKSSVRTWLYTIAVRTWIRWHEQNGQLGAGVPLGDHAELLADEAPSPSQRLEARLLREDVQAALGRVPSPFRETLVLFYIEGLKYREVAEVLDVSIGTVKSRLHEGSKRLRADLQRTQDRETQILGGDSPCEIHLKTT